MTIMDILFFSRGRGRGHAIPDLAIAKRLLHADPSLALAFASYGTGAETIRNSGCDLIDLRLSEFKVSE